jgi:hypothetical protein
VYVFAVHLQPQLILAQLVLPWRLQLLLCVAIAMPSAVSTVWQITSAQPWTRQRSLRMTMI